MFLNTPWHCLGSPARAAQRRLQATPRPWPGCCGWDLHRKTPAHNRQLQHLCSNTTLAACEDTRTRSAPLPTQKMLPVREQQLYFSNFPTPHHWGIPTLLLAIRWVCFINQGVQHSLKQQKTCTKALLNAPGLRIIPFSHTPTQDCSAWVRALDQSDTNTGVPNGWCCQQPKSFMLQKLSRPQQCWLASCRLSGMLIRWKTCIFITLSLQAAHCDRCKLNNPWAISSFLVKDD